MSKSKKKILLVDDNIAIRTIFSRLLQEQEIKVVGAGSVEEAKGKLAETGFDMVIADFFMESGQENGMDLARHIRKTKNNAEAPIILHTSQLPSNMDGFDAVSGLHHLDKILPAEEKIKTVCRLLGLSYTPPGLPGMPSDAGERGCTGGYTGGFQGSGR